MIFPLKFLSLKCIVISKLKLLVSEFLYNILRKSINVAFVLKRLPFKAICLKVEFLYEILKDLLVKRILIRKCNHLSDIPSYQENYLFSSKQTVFILLTCLNLSFTVVNSSDLQHF